MKQLQVSAIWKVDMTEDEEKVFLYGREYIEERIAEFLKKEMDLDYDVVVTTALIAKEE